jgi:3',5'-cyclic AMP phosphodiesterase CpdA
VIAAQPILLLHLSDLHFGQYSRFAGRDLEGLGRTLSKNVQQARQDLQIGPNVGLVIVSGDLAETGLREEFRQAAVFLASLAEALDLDRRQFVFCPGNHDISWLECKAAESEYEAQCNRDGRRPVEADLRRQMDQRKFYYYNAFLCDFYGLARLNGLPRQELKNDGWLYDFPDLRLSVAALNSCERESHRSSDHQGALGAAQAQGLMDRWLTEPFSGFLKIVVVHHNPDRTTWSNVEAWRQLLQDNQLAPALILRYERDLAGFDDKQHLLSVVQDTKVQLVLHGHHHAVSDRAWTWKQPGMAHVLSAGSLGLESLRLPRDEPNHARLILLDPGAQPPMLTAHSLVYQPWSRPTGELVAGGFELDQGRSGVYRQPLFLPDGFLPANAPKRRGTGNKTARSGKTTRKAAGTRPAAPPSGGLKQMGAPRPQEVPGCRLVKTHGPFQERIFHSSWSPGGDRLALGFENGRILLVQPESGAQLLSLEGQVSSAHETIPLAWSPDGAYLAVGQRGHIQYWDVKEGKDVARLRGPEPLNAHLLAWSPDGSGLVAVLEGSQIYWLEPLTRSHLSLSFLGSAKVVHAVAWSPDSARLAVGTDRGLCILAVPGGKLGDAEPFPQPIRSLLWTADGQAIFGGCSDGSVRCLDLIYRHAQPLAGTSGPVGGLLLSPNEDLLGAKDVKGMHFWRWGHWQAPSASFDEPVRLSPYSALAADPSRPRFASLAGDGNAINVWEYDPAALAGRPPLTWPERTKGVTQVEFTLDLPRRSFKKARFLEVLREAGFDFSEAHLEVWEGSTHVRLTGAPEDLRRLVDALTRSEQRRNEFMARTMTIRITWESDGQRGELTRAAGAAATSSSSPPSPGVEGRTMKRTVLELDLVGYSDVARLLDENLGPQTVTALNDQIQGFVDRGLAGLGLARDNTVMATTGDGAILVFERAEQAHRFAQAVHEVVRDHNAANTLPAAKRLFRMGAATGKIDLRLRRAGGFDLAGIKIADAVRFEAAGKPGELLIDLATHADLPEDLQRQYAPEEPIRGKRGETYRCRRCVMDLSAAAELKKIAPASKPEDAPADRSKLNEALDRLKNSPGAERFQVLESMEKLSQPPYAIDHLMIAIGMPQSERPSNVPSHGEKCTQVFQWAEARGEKGLEKLKSFVQYFLSKYGL